MVYSSEYLLQRDRDIFLKYWSFNKLDTRIKFHVGLEFDRNEKDLIIVDECDALLFEYPKKFDEFINKNACICLTATPGNDSDGVEKKVLEHLGFKVINISENEASDVLAYDKELDFGDLEALLLDLQNKCPTILFCDKEVADDYESTFAENVIRDKAILEGDKL